MFVPETAAGHETVNLWVVHDFLAGVGDGAAPPGLIKRNRLTRVISIAIASSTAFELMRHYAVQGAMMKSSTSTTREYGFAIKALGNLSVLLTTALLLAPAEAQTDNETASDTEADLKLLSFWSSPIPAPENAFEAMLVAMLRSASYCEELPLQPDFETDVTRYSLDVPHNVDVNILAAPSRPGAVIEMSLMSASGDSLSMHSAEGISVDVDDFTLEIPRVWTIGREIRREDFSVGGMPVGTSALEISVLRNGGGPSRSYVVEVNRLDPGPYGDADPECPEPQYQRLRDIVSSFE